MNKEAAKDLMEQCENRLKETGELIPSGLAFYLDYKFKIYEPTGSLFGDGRIIPKFKKNEVKEV